MKKAVLPIIIGTILSGCGSDSGSDSGTSPIPNQVNAVFMDASVVEGVVFDCDSGESGKTDSGGHFSVTSGAICAFDLDGYQLGNNREGITEKNNQVTSYNLSRGSSSLATSSVNNTDYAAKVSAILQSIDFDQSDDKIDTSDVVGSSLIEADPLASQDFEKAMEAVKVVDSSGQEVAIPADNMTTPDEAKKGLNKNFTSENVQQIVDEIKYLLASDITTVNVESTLASMRSLLETEDNSNGYHQQALDAILEIAEILNTPEVSERVAITGTNYSEVLAQAIDLTMNPNAMIEFIEAPMGTTQDVSELFAELAKRLEEASARLAAAMPGEGYELPYSKSGEALTYQDSLVIRAAALGVANTLYTLSAYNMGSDKLYLEQETTLENVELKKEVAVFSWYDDNPEERVVLSREWHESKENMDVEFDIISSDPLALYTSESVLAFHDNADEMLEFAKLSLTQMVSIAQLISLEEYLDEDELKEAEQLLVQLSTHLANEESELAVELDGEKLYANLHSFYSTETGLDRSDFIFDASYRCDTEYVSNDTNTAYSLELSKIFGEPTCSQDGNYLIDWDINDSFIDWNLVKVLDYTASISYDEQQKANTSTYTYTFIPAVDAELEVKVIESPSSNILDVLWCGIDEDTDEKISCLED